MRWHYWLWLLLALLYGYTAYHVLKREERPKKISLRFEDLTLTERMIICGLDPDQIYDLLIEEER